MDAVSLPKKISIVFVKIISFLFAILFPFFVYYMCETLAFNDLSHTFDMFENSMLKVSFSLIALYVSFFALWFIFKNSGIAAILLGLSGFLLGLIQYYKYEILEENFYPWELGLARNAASFSDFLTDILLTDYMINFFLITVLVSVVLFKFGPKIKIFWPVRSVIGLILAFSCFFYLTNDSVRLNFYPKLDIYVNSMMDQKENYNNNGFLSAFLLNAGSLRLSPPDNYSKSAVLAAMEEFSPDNSDISNVSPNVIVILAEAFWDPKQLDGTTFSKNPTENFDKIKEDYFGGFMISNTFGGGTARPEFEILTTMSMAQMPAGSLPYQSYINRDIWTMPRYYKDQGYEVIAVHPYYSSFYSRDKAYRYMGFDRFKGMDDFETDITYKSHYISDDTFANEMIFELSQKRDTPLFMFGISMENHGLYLDKYDESEYTVEVSNPIFNEDDQKVAENFTQGIYNFDQALKKLYDAVQKSNEPTVVMVFGDHLPAFNKDYEPYVKSNYLSDNNYLSWTDEDQKSMYRTPFLVFSNYDTGRPFKGDGKEVSPYYLSGLLNDYIGMEKTPYMQMLMEFFEVSPVYNRLLQIYTEGADRDVTNRFDKLHWLFTYDILKGQGYSLNP